MGRQRVQGQGAEWRRGRTGDPRHDRGAARRERRCPDRSPPAGRRGGGRARRAVRSLRWLRAVRPTHRRPRRAPRGGHLRARRPAVRGRIGLAQSVAQRWGDPCPRDPPGTQPVFRGTEPRADPAERRRGARADPRWRLRSRAAARRRR